MLLNIDELRENRHLASETIKDLKQLIHVLNGKPAKNFQDIDLLIQMQTDLLRTKDMKKFLDEKYLTICN